MARNMITNAKMDDFFIFYFYQGYQTTRISGNGDQSIRTADKNFSPDISDFLISFLLIA